MKKDQRLDHWKMLKDGNNWKSLKCNIGTYPPEMKKSQNQHYQIKFAAWAKSSFCYKNNKN